GDRVIAVELRARRAEQRRGAALVGAESCGVELILRRRGVATQAGLHELVDFGERLLLRGVDIRWRSGGDPEGPAASVVLTGEEDEVAARRPLRARIFLRRGKGCQRRAIRVDEDQSRGRAAGAHRLAGQHQRGSVGRPVQSRPGLPGWAARYALLVRAAEGDPQLRPGRLLRQEGKVALRGPGETGRTVRQAAWGSGGREIDDNGLINRL